MRFGMSAFYERLLTPDFDSYAWLKCDDKVRSKWRYDSVVAIFGCAGRRVSKIEPILSDMDWSENPNAFLPVALSLA